jgi:hypothetical protein
MRQLPGAYQLPNGDFINSPDKMLGLFIGELTRNFQPWLDRLKEDPQSLCELEREVSACCTRGAGMIVVGLMAVVHASDQFVQEAQRVRKNYAYPLSSGRERKISVQMLGGFVIWLASLYCEPGRGFSNARFTLPRPKQLFRLTSDAAHYLHCGYFFE